MANEIHDDKWLKQIIDEAIQQVLNENKTKEKHRALTAEELQEYGIAYVEVKDYSAHDIARALNNVFERIMQDGEDPSDFYCGITNDIVTRKSNHEQKDYEGREIAFVIALQCANMKTAADTEYIMHKQYGFSMGKTDTFANGAALDSDFVYIYRIPR